MGLKVAELNDHADERGAFRELFRESWALSEPPAQWNMVRSQPNVLRGVHAHHLHVDYLTVASGVMILGLHDLRRHSPTCGLSAMLRLEGEDPHLVVVPAGVAHGFYFPVASLHIYGVSAEFDGGDHFGCRWDDPALNLRWPCAAPILSHRDRTAGSREALAAAVQPPHVA